MSEDMNEYLKDLMLRHVPGCIVALVVDPRLTKVKQLVAIFVFTAAVGFGYLYAITKPNLLQDFE
ncbi:hypothetical protein [Haloarchaeobius sp. DT45]|uniref:hypothetical protein n=1 Tax=Haloarchaeobius sp. DT45 TaxID=3446116 RepID=UPI003F6BA8A8